MTANQTNVVVDLIAGESGLVRIGEVMEPLVKTDSDLIRSPQRKVEERAYNLLAMVDQHGIDADLVEDCVSDLREKVGRYEVFYASNCEAANEIIKGREVSLIIADWDVMSLDGFNPKNQGDIISVHNIPLVMLTDDLNLREKLSSADFAQQGVVDFVRKPVEFMELRSRVRLLIDMADRTRQARIEGETVRRELNLRHQELHLELIIHSESIKGKFLENIKTLDTYLNHEGKSKLRNLIRQFRWTIKDETNLNFFRAYDEMNSCLYARLEKICPKITKGEKRLCGFTLKNHSGTDIAKTIGKSQNSVNVAFARLRSKLGLATNKELRKLLTDITGEK